MGMLFVQGYVAAQGSKQLQLQGLCQVLGTRLGDRALELELFTALSSYITLDK